MPHSEDLGDRRDRTVSRPTILDANRRRGHVDLRLAKRLFDAKSLGVNALDNRAFNPHDTNEVWSRDDQRIPSDVQIRIGPYRAASAVLPDANASLIFIRHPYACLERADVDLDSISTELELEVAADPGSTERL